MRVISILVFIPLLCSCDGRKGTRNMTSHELVAIDVSANGDMIVFSSANGDLFSFDLIKGEIDQLTQTIGIETTPSYSQDGNTVTYSFSHPGTHTSHIRSLNMADRAMAELTSDDNTCDIAPRYSPDGTSIVFARAHRYRPYSMGGKVWDDWDVCVMASDGGNVRRVTSQFHQGLSSPCFGPELASVIFSSVVKRPDNSLYSAIYQAPLSGDGPPLPLTPDDCQATKCAVMGSDPSTSQCGDKMVFLSDKAKRYDYELFLMEPIGTAAKTHKLTSNGKYNSSPKIASDMDVVFFLAEEKMNSESQPLFGLWRVDTDGANLTRIAGPELFDNPLQWQVDQGQGENRTNDQ